MQSATAPGRVHDKSAPWLLFGISLLLLIALEYRFPYYFLQDDSLEYVLPAFVHNLRSLRAGELPLYNFHTLAGTPHASLGLSAPLYLPQYAAILISELIWKHPFAAIDLLAFVNALLAVFGTYAVCRRLAITPLAAVLGGMTALSGHFLWVGRMWFVSTVLSAVFPWMLWAALRYLDRPNFSRAAVMVLIRVALLSSGYPQYFLLAVLFENLFGLTWLAVAKSGTSMRTGAAYLAWNLPVALIGSPVLVPLSVEIARSAHRSAPLTYREFSELTMSPLSWLVGQVFVFLTVHVDGPAPVVWRSCIPFLSHVGYVPALVWLGALPALRARKTQRAVAIAASLCFLLALLWTWDFIGPLLYNMPLLNRFRWPFKLVFFAGFFQCLLAAFVLSRWRIRWQVLANGFFLVNWVWVFLFLPTHAWRVREHRLPPTSEWRSILEDGRYYVVSKAPIETEYEGRVDFNYAVLWGLDNLLGYEPIHSQLARRIAIGDLHAAGFLGPVDALPLEHLRRWSVRYIVVTRDRPDAAEKLRDAGFNLRGTGRDSNLWEDPAWRPPVHWTDAADPAAGLRWTRSVNAINLSLDQWPGNTIEMAFAANPGLEVCIQETCIPAAGSLDGLVQVQIPHGVRHVRLVYRNSTLSVTAIVSLVTLAAGGAFWFWSTRRVQPRLPRTSTSVD